jgi:hypothetical protein
MADSPTPKQVALARRLYRDGDSIDAILVATRLLRPMLYRCLAGDFPDGSGLAPEPVLLRSARKRSSDSGAGRAALIARMWRTAERQVDEIEKRLADSGLERAERESGARTLAVVAKTLRDLAAFDEEGNARGRGSRGEKTRKDDDDESVPRNVEDLRRALAQKLDAFVAGRSAFVSDDPE